MRNLLLSFIALPLVVGTVPAFAQSNPSADQIINSLKPTGSLVGGTRGIRHGADAAPTATPAPAQSAAPAPRAAPQTASTAGAAPAQAPSANLTVSFASGSADLTPQAIQTLNELGRALSSTALAGYKFRIEGHTDTVGTPEANRALSELRANAVVNYIVTHFGVERGRLQAVGMGEENLAVQTPPQTNEPRNRRVLVVNLGA